MTFIDKIIDHYILIRSNPSLESSKFPLMKALTDES